MAEKIMDGHIEITPNICFGKPRIAGHRITVQDIVVWHEQMGRSADAIATEYDLSLADVYAALTYYFDHREEIDRKMQEDEAFVEEQRRKTPSILQQKLQGRLPHGGGD
jgi:uncharacterized protein (DUF433 family)